MGVNSVEPMIRPLVNHGCYIVQRKGEPVIKLGFSTDIHARVRELQVGCDAELVLVADSCGFGHISDERELHATWADARIRGEWYHLTPTIAQQVIDEFGIRCWTPELKVAMA